MYVFFIVSCFSFPDLRRCTGHRTFPLASMAEDKVDTTKVYQIREVTVTEQYRNTEVRASATTPDSFVETN
jgi:hypothetical protein